MLEEHDRVERGICFALFSRLAVGSVFTDESFPLKGRRTVPEAAQLLECIFSS